MKVHFILNDSEEMTSTTIVSRSAKAKEIHKNTWNSKLSDGTIRSIDYDRDVSSFELCPICNNDDKVEAY